MGIIPAGAGRSILTVALVIDEEDHPRGCGEKFAPSPKPAKSLGSSPRVRGEAERSPALRSPAGIIPAGAGRRSGVGRGKCLRWDHPRGCGEKLASKALTTAAVGSSPRVRGEGGVRDLDAGLVGIIPAGAGRRSQRGHSRRSCWDHPRGCGEKKVMSAHSGSMSGSSPRVRGEATLRPPPRRRSGIIPAGAGRSFPVLCAHLADEDHPRGCGEKCVRSCTMPTARGSSPRVRGEGREGRQGQGRAGIIPAGAGRRGIGFESLPRHQDHPRGCGEKPPKKRGLLAGLGSSPRVRGEDHHRGLRVSRGGIIPAGAGRSGHNQFGDLRHGDHPRGCGEKSSS